MGTAAQALGLFVPAGVTEFDADLDLLAVLLFHGALTEDEAMEERDALSLRMNAFLADQLACDDQAADDEPVMYLRFSSGLPAHDRDLDGVGDGPEIPVFCELSLAA